MEVENYGLEELHSLLIKTLDKFEKYVKDNMVNIKEELKGSLKEFLFSVPRQQ